jgi:hypothetical protein
MTNEVVAAQFQSEKRVRSMRSMLRMKRWNWVAGEMPYVQQNELQEQMRYMNVVPLYT